jgi:type I restriction enzyme S subunit
MKDERKTLMPKLRFPEFRRTSGWEAVALDDVCDVLNNRRQPITSNDRQPGPYPYYGASGIVDYVDDYIFDERLVLVGEDGAKWGPFESTAFLAEGKYWVNNHAHVLKPHGLIDSILVAYLTMLDMGPFITGAAPPKLTLGKLKTVPIPVPSSTAEQRKIAACLTSLDELLAAEGRKLAGLRAHKKGLMQKLFPREGESRPRLRFPEFRDAPEWEPRKLAEFITERCEPASADIPLYSLTIEAGVTAKTERYERSFLVTDETDAYKVVRPDDFAFNPMNLRFGAIGIHSGHQPVGLSKYYNIFSCDESVDSSFCDIYFRSDVMVALYDKIATGSLIEKRRVHFDRFLKLDIPFPSRAEQQRIAACLSSLDGLIAAQSRKLDGLRAHKKALMQQLFPSPEGI